MRSISALKANQKTLKAEKLDLLGQMRQLYGTLEDKEAELGNFIQNFEKRIQESNETVVKVRETSLLISSRSFVPDHFIAVSICVICALIWLLIYRSLKFLSEYCEEL